MDFKQLSYFTHVAELGSFTRAEDALSVSQSQLSRQVRLLEAELDQELFERNGRGVSLTDAGRRLLVHAQTIMKELERARRSVSPDAATMTGDIVVGLPPSVARAVTVPLAEAFRERFPRARLRLYELLSVQVLEWLAEGRLDIGLVHNPPPSSHYDSVPLISEEIYLIGRADSQTAVVTPQPPIAAAELAKYPFIVQSGLQTRRLLIDSDIASAQIEMNIVVEAGSTEAVLDLVLAGMGYAALPLSTLGDRRDAFAVRPIVEPSLALSLALLTATRRPVPAMTPIVEEMLRNIVALLIVPSVTLLER